MSWWTRLLQRRRLEGELDRELRDHVERQVADHLRAGLTEDAARRRARLDFGGVDQIKETCRDVRGTRWLEETWQDLRFAARLLVKEPWVAAGAVLALGLGLGISSVAFTAYNGLLLRGLPVDDQHRVTALAMRDETGGEQGVSYLDFLDWRDATGSFRGIAAYSEPPMNVSDPGMGTEQFFGARVTANAFGLLGVRPVIGRDFRPDDDRPGASPVVLLGHGIWTTRYGAAPEVLGRIIRVNDVPSTVVGVMPEGFEFPFWADLWQPLSLTPGLAEHERDRRALASLRPPRGRCEPHPGAGGPRRGRGRPGRDASRHERGAAAPTRPVPRVLPPAVSAGLERGDGGGGARSPHWVRQCGQPAARARRPPLARGRHAGHRSARRGDASCGSCSRRAGSSRALAGVLGLGLAALAARLLSLGIAPLEGSLLDRLPGRRPRGGVPHPGLPVDRAGVGARARPPRVERQCPGCLDRRGAQPGRRRPGGPLDGVAGDGPRWR